MKGREDARRILHEMLADLEALRPFVDPIRPEAAPFVEAWKAALEEAEKAATDYAEAIRAWGR